jgi:hypothetical protein
VVLQRKPKPSGTGTLVHQFVLGTFHRHVQMSYKKLVFSAPAEGLFMTDDVYIHDLHRSHPGSFLHQFLKLSSDDL